MSEEIDELYVSSLESSVEDLEEQNEKLQAEVARLQKELDKHQDHKWVDNCSSNPMKIYA